MNQAYACTLKRLALLLGRLSRPAAADFLMRPMHRRSDAFQA
jgi:hypothetical protein